MILVFDLDGTLSDPSVGITASLNFALENLGFQTQPYENLKKFIGPSLISIFSELLDTRDEKLIWEGIAFFRKRYFDMGYKENFLYPGIFDALEQLKRIYRAMYIATTKRTDIAKSVTDYFNITSFFKEILGCGTKLEKRDLLEFIKKSENGCEMTMIGDRSIDMAAGKASGCFCVGVLWGFGSERELSGSGADVLLKETRQLVEWAYGNA